MSLRRSARNAKAAVTEAPESLYEKACRNGSSKKPSSPPHRDIDYPAPSPGLQKKLNARKKPTATPKATLSQKNAAPKKPAPSRKHKAPATEQDLDSSVGIVTNVSNVSETLASTGAPPEVNSQALPEAHASTDVSKPLHPNDADGPITIPSGIPGMFADGPPPEPGTGRLPTPDMSGNSVDSLPTTPVSKKRQKRKKADTVSPSKPVPFTPTPSGVGLIAGSKNMRTAKEDHMLDDLASLNRNRPAAPNVTNAPVLTPNGSQLVVNESPAKKRKANDLPPDVGSPMKSTSTIETLLKDAEAYLVKVDKEVAGNGRLERLIRSHQCKMFNPEGLREVVDPFTALASGIIGQQVSGAAAASIRKKFTALFEDTHPAFPSPTQVLTKDLPTLRKAGLSQRKAEYITGLAEKFAFGEFTAEGLVSASDEDLIEKLVAVRGLGRWSVEMFACFGLKRMDVFSTGDLGVQRGMAAYMGRDVSKLKNKGGKWKYMSEQEMLSIASKFSPYRSVFMWYMWRIADVDTEVLE